MYCTLHPATQHTLICAGVTLLVPRARALPTSRPACVCARPPERLTDAGGRARDSRRRHPPPPAGAIAEAAAVTSDEEPRQRNAPRTQREGSSGKTTDERRGAVVGQECTWRIDWAWHGENVQNGNGTCRSSSRHWDGCRKGAGGGGLHLSLLPFIAPFHSRSHCETRAISCGRAADMFHVLRTPIHRAPSPSRFHLTVATGREDCRRHHRAPPRRAQRPPGKAGASGTLEGHSHRRLCVSAAQRTLRALRPLSVCLSVCRCHC